MPTSAQDPGAGPAADRPLPRRGWLPHLLRRFFTHPICRHGYRVVMIVMLSLALNQLNIAGTQRGFDNLAQDMVMQAGDIAGIWPEHDPLRGSGATQHEVAKEMRATARPGVTLFLWTDPAMQFVVDHLKKGDIWPITYRAHAETVYAAIKLGAKAVFLDFVFPTERDDEHLSYLENVIQYDLPESDARLFIACDPDEYDPPAFERLVEAMKVANAEARANGKTEPVAAFVPATLPKEAVVRTYDLAVDVFQPEAIPEACGGYAGFSDAEGKITRATSAAPMLVASAGAVPDLKVTAESRPMTLFWDRRTHVVTQRLFEGIRTAPETLCTWLSESLWGVLFDLDLLRRDLAGPAIVPADHLFAAGVGQIDDNPRTVTITDLVKDRIVIIGSAQPSAADVRNTPNAPARPGALVHAMAVDNLLQFGTRYVKERSVGEVIPAVATVPWVAGADMSFAILLSVLVLSSFLFSLWVENDHGANEETVFREISNEPIAHRMKYSLGIGVVAVFVMGVLLLVLRLPPANWFSTLLAFAVVTAPWGLLVFNHGLLRIMFTRDPSRALVRPETTQTRGDRAPPPHREETGLNDR